MHVCHVSTDKTVNKSRTTLTYFMFMLMLMLMFMLMLDSEYKERTMVKSQGYIT
jgi:hypothetical protein